jgi:2-oxoglutarate ferredoxin oxidoreductase subunit alpha
MNDEGLYGFGQLATLLRARYSLPSIGSLTKTDGLTFRISEIVNGVLQRLGRAGTDGGYAKPSRI